LNPGENSASKTKPDGVFGVGCCAQWCQNHGCRQKTCWYEMVDQHFPNCGLRPKSGSRSSVKWVAIVFCKYLFFCHLLVNS